MNYLKRLWVRIKSNKGQDMAEYALIMAAVAVAGFLAYQTLATSIAALITTVNADL